MEKRQTTRAAALKYDMGRDEAPCIVGLGEGYVAQKMLDTAARNDIPVVEDQSLAGMLGKLSVGDEIPEELYQAVAQVLAFISRLDAKGAGRYTLEEIRRNSSR